MKILLIHNIHNHHFSEISVNMPICMGQPHVNDHIPNQIIQQQLANDSVQINSTNLLKRRENIQKSAYTKLKLYRPLYILNVDMPNHDV